MLNKNADNLLKFLCENDKKGEYVVLSFEDIKSTCNISDFEELNKLIKILKDEEYVLVKYIDEDAICYTVTGKLKNKFSDSNNYDDTLKTQKNFFIIQIILSALFSFLGSFIAVLILYYII